MTSTESTASVDATGDADKAHQIPTLVPPIPSIRASTKAVATTLDEYKEKYQFSITNPNKFWFQQASELISWFTFPFDATTNVCQGNFKKGDVTWFANAKLNMCYNAIDRHVNDGNGDKLAMIWEGDEVDEIRHLTFSDMQHEVTQICHVLARHGVTKGSVVTIYMPMSTLFITFTNPVLPPIALCLLLMTFLHVSFFSICSTGITDDDVGVCSDGCYPFRCFCRF